MSACQLCESTDDVVEHAVPPRDATILVCSRCAAGIDGDMGEPSHWFCLQGSIWSEVPAVQVTSWRLLRQVGETWASDVLEQVYLDEDALEWAKALDDTGPATVDSNGTPLADGDSVTLIKDLDVKGAGFTAKRGTMVKNIRLTDDPGLVEGRVNKTAIYLKTEFLKRA